jgi:hypothetical protein
MTKEADLATGSCENRVKEFFQPVGLSSLEMSNNVKSLCCARPEGKNRRQNVKSLCKSDSHNAEPTLKCIARVIQFYEPLGLPMKERSQEKALPLCLKVDDPEPTLKCISRVREFYHPLLDVQKGVDKGETMCATSQDVEPRLKCISRVREFYRPLLDVQKGVDKGETMCATSQDVEPRLKCISRVLEFYKPLMKTNGLSVATVVKRAEPLCEQSTDVEPKLVCISKKFNKDGITKAEAECLGGIHIAELEDSPEEKCKQQCKAEEKGYEFSSENGYTTCDCKYRMSSQ